MNTLTFRTKQEGAVLAVALMMLLVMTIVAISAMDGNTLGYKMSTNAVFQEQAFNNSESGRTMVGPMLFEYSTTASADWDKVTKQDDVSVMDTSMSISSNSSSDTNIHLLNKTRAPDFMLNDTTNKMNAEMHMFYRAKSHAPGDPLFIYRFYDIRSEGNGSKGANTWTASDYRTVPQAGGFNAY